MSLEYIIEKPLTDSSSKAQDDAGPSKKTRESVCSTGDSGTAAEMHDKIEDRGAERGGGMSNNTIKGNIFRHIGKAAEIKVR
ncbi:MAG: hypothetical protein M1834_002632 [Cirrosporium novae-zelandiae]|nr:MAG: hypothetical protein M1834_002632 [Cirrosporium novae-zelandiae]